MSVELFHQKTNQIFIYHQISQNYNYTNQDSKFYSNVKIKYDDKEITCEFWIECKENLAVAYENVIFKNSGSIMKAKIL